MASPRVVVMPFSTTEMTEAVTTGGGVVTTSPLDADAIIWLDPRDPSALRAALEAAPQVRWVQLPFAGVEDFVAAHVIDDRRTWTCAKGVFAEATAEHALALALAVLRDIPTRSRARSWGVQSGRTLFDQRVTILGGGGIASELLELLAPFRVRATVVRRHATPMRLAERVLGPEQLDEALAGALVTFVAVALTAQTESMIARRELRLIGPEGYLVNVARGRVVDTADLTEALLAGEIAGAGLDVTDPEPLPDDDPLWGVANCLITPHTANPPSMAAPALARFVTANVARFVAGEVLAGTVDLDAGY